MKYNHVIILLLVSIVGLIVSTQLFVHQKIKNQQQHFTVINQAGKQRMLSQVIVKTVLNIEKYHQRNQNYDNLNMELRNLKDEFKSSHESLKNGNPALGFINHNSAKTQLMLSELGESYDIIQGNAAQLIVENNSDNINLIIESILSNEERFLSKMDAITTQYNLDFIDENKQLGKWHLITSLFIMIVLILEVLFLVKPAFRKLMTKNENLHDANESLLLQNQEIDSLKSNVKTKNRQLKQKSQMLSNQKEVLRNQLDEVSKTSDINEVFIKNLTYGMRVPLNAMIGMLRLLERTSPTDEQHRHINSLTKIAKTSLSNVNNVINFQELEAYKIKLENDTFNIKTAIKSIQEALLPIALDKSVEFTMRISENVPEFLIGDTRRLKHIIYNLTYNAIKASRNGEVTIDVFLNHINKENIAHLDFAISDSSYGISDEDSPYVFELIQPKGKSTYYNSLELAIAKKLLELQDSTITVESIIGKGTTFYFSLELSMGKNE